MARDLYGIYITYTCLPIYRFLYKFFHVYMIYLKEVIAGNVAAYLFLLALIFVSLYESVNMLTRDGSILIKY